MQRNSSVPEVRRDREEMAKKKNQILVEWWESKDAGEKNCVNVKHTWRYGEHYRWRDHLCQIPDAIKRA